MKCPKFFLFVFTLGFAAKLSAAIIGTNVPALPLTVERIATLPSAQQSVWTEYLERSQRQMQADKGFLQSEMRAQGLTNFIVPPSGRSAKSVPLGNRQVWYSSAEARRIADIIVSFQTPAGGWGKNLDMTKHLRAPGESFASNNNSHFLGSTDFDSAPDTNWDYVGTFDNDATITELNFLRKIIAATGEKESAPYRAAFLRGLDYIFAAQYPNGGWPQVWPLQGGYHDTITFNDDAMINILNLLQDVSAGTDEFSFMPEKSRALAAASLKRGIACILATQIVTDGCRTVWCQQHDALTLQPASARNYEMPSQVSSESANIMKFLMEQPDPDSNIVVAVDAAAVWFKKAEIHDVAYKFSKKDGRHLISAPGNGPLWARYYEIGTDRPIFGDRDKSIHDDVNEISKERRNGYSWFNDDAKRMLEHYARWKKQLARQNAHGLQKF
jgi:PelA/Pel-15E family pectate lyase